ncbi:PLP-dependent aminotransferase family protein [Rhodophyticola sp. CCM32]|nr:PLP-dependent aminotransferase family protein [Rhodophyticola sp. CCM32]
MSEHHIFLSEDPSVGLQTRLKETITRAIWDGRFSPGDRLPATRALARHLGISRITVSLAYDSLVASGYVVPHARSGFFVADDAPNRRDTVGSATAVPDDQLDWSARLGPPPAALGSQAKTADWRRFQYPFIFGEPDLRHFPVDDWRDCARQALGKRYFERVADDAADRDDPMLLEQIIKRSISGRGVAAHVEEVLVTTGAQNALWLAARVLLAPDRAGAIVMEEPGYPELRNLLKALGAPVLPVPVDREGLIVDRIPPGTRVVFVTPSHQAPTGATMSMARREALLARAEAEDFIVVEDDYDYEMSYQSPGLPALKSLDQRGRVIYIGSFSKSVFPGLRLGYMTAPEPFVQHARALRTMMVRHPPGLTQRTAAYFLSAGHYNAHARRMRARMGRRHSVLRTALEAEGLHPAIRAAFGGASLWLKGPEGLDADQLAVDLRDRNMLIEPGSAFYAAQDPPKNYIRIGFSTIPTARIPEGITILAAAIRAQLAGM